MKKKSINTIIKSYIYPIVLLILPLLTANQGVDVSDSTYSLGNYLFADSLEGMWVISTYLSNLLGSLIVHLPGGGMLFYANIYTGIVKAAIALVVYFSFRNEFEASYLFLGECIALCICWIPTGILYNYASYLLMSIGAILLYKAILKDNRCLLMLAGVVFGLNVFVRIPNVTQVAFILVLWIYAIYTGQKFGRIAKQTVICIMGYIIGIAMPLLMIISRYKLSGLSSMFTGLTSITATDETYSPWSMIAGTFMAYVRSLRWFGIIAAVVICAVVMYKLCPQRYIVIKTTVYIAVIVLMLRFFWGRGMYSFRYYEDYSAMYEWGMMALIVSILLNLYVLVFRAKEDKSLLLLSLISLVVIMIAPLGSNNYTYQNINNMFLVMPATIIFGIDVINYMPRKLGKEYAIPIGIMFLTLLMCILIQGYGFNLCFVFRDGMRGESRDIKVEGVASLKGMYTNAQNAESLMRLGECIEQLDPDSMILYGDCPGLTYIFGIPSALYTSWADLDSNSVNDVKDGLDNLRTAESKPPVILRKGELGSLNSVKKYELIMDYISDEGYLLIYNDAQYEVYFPE